MSKRPDPFGAIADPTRRAILVLLRDEAPRTAGALADAFPAISRPAVSKHLRILREAGLVAAEQHGREWRYRLEVAGLARMQRDWFERFGPLIERSLHRLKAQVEGAQPAARKPRRRR